MAYTHTTGRADQCDQCGGALEQNRWYVNGIGPLCRYCARKHPAQWPVIAHDGNAEDDYALCRRVPAQGVPDNVIDAINNVIRAGNPMLRDKAQWEQDVATIDAWLDAQPQPGQSAMPEPDWVLAPKWANYAIPILSWSGFEGTMLRWEWYENAPEWGKRAWKWKSGTWGPGTEGSADAVPVHEIIGMKHMLRKRPQPGQEASE